MFWTYLKVLPFPFDAPESKWGSGIDRPKHGGRFKGYRLKKRINVLFSTTTRNRSPSEAQNRSFNRVYDSQKILSLEASIAAKGLYFQQEKGRHRTNRPNHLNSEAYSGLKGSFPIRPILRQTVP